MCSHSFTSRTLKERSVKLFSSKKRNLTSMFKKNTAHTVRPIARLSLWFISVHYGSFWLALALARFGSFRLPLFSNTNCSLFHGVMVDQRDPPSSSVGSSSFWLPSLEAISSLCSLQRPFRLIFLSIIFVVTLGRGP